MAGNEFDTTTACNNFMATTYHLHHKSKKGVSIPGDVRDETKHRETEMLSCVEVMKSCLCLTSSLFLTLIFFGMSRAVLPNTI